MTSAGMPKSGAGEPAARDGDPSRPARSPEAGKARTDAASRRQYGYSLLVAVVGAALLLVALRRPWARVTFAPPRPLPSQVISVTGQDLVPVAAALALAALACLAAVVASRGRSRQVAGGLLAVLGAWAGISALVSVNATSAVSVAAGHVGSPTASAATGAVGSTTAGSGNSGSTVVVSGTVTHVVMTGGTWKGVAAIGAVLIILAGLSIAWRARWLLPGRKTGGRPADARPAPDVPPAGRVTVEGEVSSGEGRPEGSLDSAVLWEALSRGSDPT